MSNTIDPRVLDALVEQNVFGRDVTWVKGSDGAGIPCVLGQGVGLIIKDETPEGKSVDGVGYVVARYTTDPAADYSVLVHVRENWDWEAQQKFAYCLDQRVYMARQIKLRSQIPRTLIYQPGDYSRAALQALGVEVGPVEAHENA